MSKKTVIAGLSTIALVGGGSVVHADTVTDPANTPTITTGTESQSEAVTKEQVDTAKTNANTAQTDVNSAQAKANSTQAEQDKAQESVNTAQSNVDKAQEVVNQATPEAIEKARMAVTNAQTEVANAQTDVSNTSSNETTAQNKLDDQKQVVSDIKTEVVNAQKEVDTAKSDVAEKQAILDGTGASAIIEKAEQTQAKQDQDQQVVNTAEANLVKAQEADAIRQANINSDNVKIANATTDLTQKTNELSTATSNATTAQNNLASATNKYTTALNDYNAINTITLSSDYIKYLKQYYENGYNTPAYNEAVQKLKEMNQSLKDLNWYKANKNDSETLLDANNLTEAQLTNISFFAQDLINQIRKQFGTSETVESLGAIRFADAVTDGYVANDWSWLDVSTNGHDNAVINGVAKNNNLMYDATNEEQYYENMYSTANKVDQLTMGQVKNRIYDAIVGFMFNGYEYLHAQSIAGLMSNGKTDYLGVDLSTRTGVTGVHVEMVNADNIKPGSTFDTAPLINTKTAQAITDAYNKAKTGLTNATTANNTAKANLASATNAYNTAKATLVSLQNQLAKDMAVAVQTPSAKQSLDLAKDKLAQSTAENIKAQDAVKALQADIKVKTQALNDAKAVLVEKQANLDSENQKLASANVVLLEKQAELVKAQEAVKKAENNLTQATIKLAQATEYYQVLIHAPARLAEAKQALVEAQEKLTKAKETNQLSQKQLAELMAIRDEKKAIYEDLVARYNAQMEAERQADLEAKRQAIEAKGNIAIPVFDQSGKVIDYVVSGSKQSQPLMAKVSYNLNSNQTVEQKGYGSSLPHTGSKENISMFVMGTILFTLGLASRKFKKKSRKALNGKNRN